MAYGPTKYIAFESIYGIEVVIFSNSIVHRDMADAVARIRDGRPRTPVSAGFTDGTRFFGRSESMNLDSNNDHFQYAKI